MKASGMSFYIAMEDLGAMSWNVAMGKCQNYSFCGNVKGTLPTKDQLLSIYNNKAQVNTLLSTNGGTKMTNGNYWSSTGGNYHYYYYVNMPNGYALWVDGDDYYHVRPVLTSW